MKKVVCDECQQIFEVKEKETWCPEEGKVIVGEPVRVRAFMCPYCQRVYLTSVMTKKMIEEAEKINKMRLQLEKKEIKLRNKFSLKLEKGDKV